MKNLFNVGLALGVVLLTAACAPMPEAPKTSKIDKIPVVSPTVSAEAQQRFLKRKVAIARFTDETRHGNGFFHNKDGDRIGKQAMDILSSKLAATDKFILLERADIAKINKELKMGNLAALNIPADYLIIGSVSEFGRKTDSDVGIFSRTKKQLAYATVNIRLIDVKTGQIVYSEEGSGEAFSQAGSTMGVGKRAGFDGTLGDKAIAAAIGKMVSNVVENLMDKPWRAYLLDIQDGMYFISGGASQGIMEGDTFKVFKKGKTIKNPQTGLPLELPGTEIASIKVAQIIGKDGRNEVSLCRVEKGTIPTDFSQLYVEADF
ncbi:curli production assembly protein CsgG [Geothermobacter hydrogeniphilus]|uniref:Curli production assembly protein CsgG n=1 Tax=Geothermobacter hydrogeniphilus TaxID=1969733 RepID=A0A2K2H5P8_9BACT|nr:CsgG/HfaB family protein [Geothermobacter hydrogeniphilus]PNU18642.1 curli production assembly protein CsgG [Geothermobacter hydrogeniphilus]